MTTAPDHHEPFDAEPFSDEERELAARLGRMGPVGGPSPALDATILAAAHAASVPRVRGKRRYFAWLGVPPALVTGVGVAAAAVLVLGVVWQLRPQYGAVTAQSEANAGEEIILIAPPSDAAAPRVADAPAKSQRAASPISTRPAQPKASPPAAARASSDPEPVSQAAASAPAPPPAAASDKAGMAAPPPAPEAYARETDAAAGARPVEDGYVPAPPAADRHATYTTAARAEAERRERSAAQRAAAAAAGELAAAQKAAAATASEEESTTLDRIEVTGSRIRGNADVDWAEVPVSDDAHLPSIEWLERIRARRDSGDTDNARASLKLFQREYPRIRLPADLRAFLAETTQ